MTCIGMSVWSILKITGNYWFELFSMCIKIIHGRNTPTCRRILIHFERVRIIFDYFHCVSVYHTDPIVCNLSRSLIPMQVFRVDSKWCHRQFSMVLFLIYLFRQGWWTSIQWFGWCLQKDIGYWWYPRSLQRFRHLCCWYFHLQRFLLRSLWLPQANPSPTWCWLPRLIHPRLQ